MPPGSPSQAWLPRMSNGARPMAPRPKTAAITPLGGVAVLEQVLAGDRVEAVARARAEGEGDAGGVDALCVAAREDEDYRAGNRERRGRRPAAVRPVSSQREPEEAGESWAAAEGDDRADRDAGLVDGGEEAEL